MPVGPQIPFVKPPITFADQIQKLQQRGLIVSNRAEAEFYLSQLNYYRFAAYCLPFEQDHASHTFQANTKFEDVLNLYIFDRELRLLMLDAIERFEVSLRTQIAYSLSHSYGTAHPHLNPAIFHSTQIYDKSVENLEGEVNRSREDFIRHLTNKYSEDLPPIWAAVELMTIGQLSKWYSNIKKRRDRQDIARAYQVDESILTSFCKHLTHVRNYSAHHARLWNRGFTLTMTVPRRGPQDLVAGLDSTQQQGRAQRKIYNTLVMLIHLMNIMNPGHHWKQRLIDLIQSHKIDTSKMGFPADWQQRQIWQ
ncbi:ABC transporter permease [Shewanella sairae]|uniref:ABC transporter permease n=1 Tax=Shewanella sairae TaxID=190310 RepID=A0ABQ4PQY0_9GAMM|nr:Abi family protein [Shewanella sairae]MCL1132394.1 Abi family protein [Shewanella sairae]GIU51738.1 ABC transporter permease [Shewanella sairae]